MIGFRENTLEQLLGRPYDRGQHPEWHGTAVGSDQDQPRPRVVPPRVGARLRKRRGKLDVRGRMVPLRVSQASGSIRAAASLRTGTTGPLRLRGRAGAGALPPRAGRRVAPGRGRQRRLPGPAVPEPRSSAPSSGSRSGPTATGRAHWLVYARNGVVSVFGLAADNSTRIADPADPDRRTFQWLLEAQYDPKGNAILYQYKPEDGAGVDAKLSFETRRATAGRSFAQRYLKRILYGNSRPLSHRQPADAGERVALRGRLRLRRAPPEPIPDPDDASRAGLDRARRTRFPRTGPASRFAPTACAAAS